MMNYIWIFCALAVMVMGFFFFRVAMINFMKPATTSEGYELPFSALLLRTLLAGGFMIVSIVAAMVSTFILYIEVKRIILNLV